MSNKFISLLLAIALITGTTACSDDTAEKKVDVSAVKVAFSVKPFYKDFAALDTNHFAEGLGALRNAYPAFTDFFLDTLLPFNKVEGQYNNPAATAAIKNIFSFKDYTHLTDTVLKVFSSTEKYDKEIGQMLQHVKYYFPKWQLPTEVTYFVSCLNKWTAFTHDQTIGIGLDMFLGQNFRPYEALSMPQYALINHTPENIPLWAARAVYQDNFGGSPYRKDLLELMLANGKEILFLKKVMPDFKFNLIMGYTPEQLKWCEANEALIFNLFLQQNLLFNKDYQAIMRYVTPGPNSAGFPPEAPGNLGTYIGYKILKAYEQKTGKTLEEILSDENANSIFQQSKYKP
ncbi:MAG: hypothetical protein BGO31_16785 [Bacteroidetes bacterium 43-16]|nr:MAG: hypothetical protein BGO31_16785 [Bacteroidetes bacterium 43-16]